MDQFRAAFSEALQPARGAQPRGRPRGRSRALATRPARYMLGVFGALGLVWALTAAYMLFAPVKYTSHFSLILPGSGAGSSINLESIGQAQNTTSSAFGSGALSPTEAYKQLITSDTILARAAERAHVPEGRFPKPKVSLITQTNLIEVTISGRTAKGAQANGEALRQAFLAELDTLRADEAAKREASDLTRLQELSAKERAAQRKLIAFQASHGLATLEQFNARIASVDGLRDKERDLRVALRQHSGESQRLASNLASNPRAANQAWRLRGDPVFQELATRYASSNADAELKSGTLGPNHGAMAQANAERGKLKEALLRRGREITHLDEAALLVAVDITLADGRSALLQTMDMGDAQASGTASALRELRGDLSRAAARSPELIEQASQLADLQRDHRVAEAVFSSALARLDTNKLDPFASYPLVQTLAAPDLPASRTSPSLAIALAGALGASIMILIGFGLLWQRQSLIARLQQKR